MSRRQMFDDEDDLDDEEDVCDVCGGSGGGEDPWLRCTACNGTGKAESQLPHEEY